MALPDFLINRYKEWKNHSYDKNKFDYKTASESTQKPEAMIISCCDSRVQETNIFKAKIGELFIHKNIANIVFPYKPETFDLNSEASLEYAVKVLKVPNIIVLGHSNCGGIKHAYNLFVNKNIDEEQVINKYLNNIKNLFNNVPSDQDENNLLQHFEKENIKNSIKNLKSFPYINELVKQKKLSLHGLWYEIKTGKLMYIEEENQIYNFIDYK